MAGHRYHLIFSGRFEPLVGAAEIELLHVEKLALVERGEVRALAGAQIAAGTFDPQHFDFFAGERISLHQLVGSVTTSGVGDALILAQKIGAINELLYLIERLGFGVIPKIVNVFVVFHDL